ncbi:malate dehydrogenase [Clostridium polyendosporum]|uniref:Malate dehydrogenase n=1 Tax=Clostridium polyendosporum TaxID=69208 RepID=A0A919RWD0_9CLOT|nr:Ldh family oxidoreductase [Clostridium polyendosporum]GIM27687.1 malate dehydrogenase [Clostridium polyendosporum]
MGYSRYKYEDLKKLCNVAFQRFGFSKVDRETITDVLLLSDLFGIESHGVQRLVRYHKGIKSGMMKVHAEMEIVHETPVSAVIDAHQGMGQVVGKRSMEMAIKKAKNLGMGMVVVRNSNHYGIAGYYARMAAQEGLLGMSMTNSEAIQVPTFGKAAMMGSNPIAIAMPAEPYPFLLDMSTTVVTRGKLEIYNKRAEALPLGWALDSKGADSSDAKDVLYNIQNKLGGGIVPLGGSSEEFGGHKGYGLGVSVELFTAILSGGLTANYTHMNNVGGTCHWFFAVDYGIFGDKKVIEAGMSKYLQELRDSDKAEGQDRIYTHGEKEIEAYNDRLANGILVNENTLEEIRNMCNYLDLSVNDYLKEI